MFDDDYGYEMEAIETERFDADMEMAQLTARANAAEAQRRGGVCQHSSRVGKPASGEIFYPEQFVLSVGEEMCTERTGGCSTIGPTEFVDDPETGRVEWHYRAEWEPAVWDADGPQAANLRDRIARLPDGRIDRAEAALLRGERGESVSWFVGGWED